MVPFIMEVPANWGGGKEMYPKRLVLRDQRL